jgi:hypothetical protein
MDSREIFKSIIDNKNQISEALYSVSSSGLLLLFRLYDLESNKSEQVYLIADLLEDISEEQVYYDVFMIRDILGVAKYKLQKKDIEELICLFMDYAIYKPNAFGNLKIEGENVTVIKRKEKNPFFDIFCYRLLLMYLEKETPTLRHVKDLLSYSIQGVKKFPLNFFEVFKVVKTFKELMRNITSLEMISSNDALKALRLDAVNQIRNLTIEMLNDNVKTIGVVRYLYSSITPYIDDESELNAVSRKDQKLLDSPKRRNIMINTVILIVSLFWLGPSLADSYHQWYMSSERERGHVLTVSAVGNPDLKSKLNVGDGVSRVNDIVNPTLTEFRREVTEGNGELRITRLREGKFKTITVDSLVEEGEFKRVGVSFYHLSNTTKIFTVLITIYLLIAVINLGAYTFRSIGVISDTLFYMINLAMICSYVIFYKIFLSALGLNFTTLLIIFGFIIGCKYIYDEQWILKGWLGVIRS